MKLAEHVNIGEQIPISVGLTKGIIKSAEKNDKIIAVLEDMGLPGLEWFIENAPNRIVECGIAEANAAVVAAGLAAEGYTPILYSFVLAAIARAYNQIRQSICVDRLNVKILAREGAWGSLGISHNYVEGIAAMRVLPNMVIVNPADTTEAEKSMLSITDYIGPVFLRLEADYASPPTSQLFTEDYPFELGRAYTVKDGEDATVIATGFMVTQAIKAAEILEKKGIDIRILNMSTIKPLDQDTVIKAAEETGALVVAENHSIIGGLGEAVAAILAEEIPTPMSRFGVRDEFSQSGIITEEKDELAIHFKLRAEDLVKSVNDVISRKK